MFRHRVALCVRSKVPVMTERIHVTVMESDGRQICPDPPRFRKNKEGKQAGDNSPRGPAFYAIYRNNSTRIYMTGQFFHEGQGLKRVRISADVSPVNQAHLSYAPANPIPTDSARLEVVSAGLTLPP
jgi:hypothetical protein